MIAVVIIIVTLSATATTATTKHKLLDQDMTRNNRTPGILLLKMLSTLLNRLLPGSQMLLVVGKERNKNVYSNHRFTAIHCFLKIRFQLMTL